MHQPTTQAMSESATIRNHAAFIWSVAGLLRGDYKQSEYGAHPGTRCAASARLRLGANKDGSGGDGVGEARRRFRRIAFRRASRCGRVQHDGSQGGGEDDRGCGQAMPQTKALWDALAVRGPDAPLVTDKKGNAEPDAESRLAWSAVVATRIREGITLLQGRKHVLITAAVMGRLDLARDIAEEAS